MLSILVIIMRNLGQINMKYLVAIAILMIILMLAVLLSHTEFGKGIKRMNSGVLDITDDITKQADDVRNLNVFDPLVS